VENYGAARPATDGSITEYMHFTCWIIEVRDPHSEYVILIVFQLQQWLHEGTSTFRHTYSGCSVFGCVQQNYKERMGRPGNQTLSCCTLPTTFSLRFSKICLSFCLPLPEGQAGTDWERSQKQTFLVPTVMITMYCPSRGPLFSCLSVQ
jgi:hypothetical protein